MLLTKKINNNVAEGVDSAGREVVVFGKGVGFHRMPYQLTDADVVQRVFYDVSRDVASVASTIDDDVLLASSDIVELARMDLECKLSPNLAFTLADHLQFAIQRVREGIQIQNLLAHDIAFVYPTELRIARTGVAMVNHSVKGANLPEDEASAIALHLVNGEVGGAGDQSTIDLVMQSARIMTKVSQIIEDQLHVQLDHESYAYGRFVAHFRYLVARLMRGEAENTSNSSLFQQAAEDFQDIFDCVQSINDYLKQEYGWTLSNEEQLYLMMHVNRLITAR
ncbi:MAG: PRD domain-containing protein [Atopobiaceae bacterium]